VGSSIWIGQLANSTCRNEVRDPYPPLIYNSDINRVTCIGGISLQLEMWGEDLEIEIKMGNKVR
jgi:hypothetical protein